MTLGRNDGCKPFIRHTNFDIGLCKGTRIMTAEGNLPVEYLQAGDRITTQKGTAELRHVASRMVPVIRPVLVRAGVLGQHRPTRDLVLGPDQRVYLPNWRARVRFGSDQASAPVSQLIDGEFIRQTEASVKVQIYNLEFDTPQIIYAEGAEIMSATCPVQSAYIFAAE